MPGCHAARWIDAERQYLRRLPCRQRLICIAAAAATPLAAYARATPFTLMAAYLVYATRDAALMLLLRRRDDAR